MAFNLLAFAGGLGEAAYADARRKEEKAWEIEQFDMQEKADDRRAAAAEARATRKQSQELAGQLASYGLNKDEIAGILDQGIGFAQGAVTVGSSYAASGKSFKNAIVKPGDVLSTKTVPSGTASSGRATSTAQAPDQVADSWSFIPLASVAESKGFEKDIADLNIALLSASAKDAPAIQANLEKTLSAYTRYKKAGDTSDPTATPAFTNGTVYAAAAAARKPFYAAMGFNLDLEGKVEGGFSGREGEQLVAELNTAEYLEQTYGGLNDATMNASIQAIRDLTNRTLKQYTSSTALNLSSARRILASNASEAKTKAERGEYKVGDVIVFNMTNGDVKALTYTGIPDANGLPFFSIVGG
jgi:hypothetical protein